MERSGIRGIRSQIVPDSAALHPGYGLLRFIQATLAVHRRPPVLQTDHPRHPQIHPRETGIPGQHRRRGRPAQGGNAGPDRCAGPESESGAPCGRWRAGGGLCRVRQNHSGRRGRIIPDSATLHPGYACFLRQPNGLLLVKISRRDLQYVHQPRVGLKDNRPELFIGQLSLQLVNPVKKLDQLHQCLSVVH